MKIETGLPELVGLVGKVLAPLGNSAADIYGGLVGDRLSNWRLKNFAKTAHQTNAFIASHGLNVNHEKIPERFALAWFEEATKADEDDLQQMFARLLGRAAAENSAVEPDRRLIDILGRMTADDAAVFNRIYSDQPFPDAGIYSTWKGIGSAHDREWPEDWCRSLLKTYHPESAGKAVEHLISLGVLRREQPAQFDTSRKLSGFAMSEITRELEKAIKHRTYLAATELGIALYEAVRN